METRSRRIVSLSLSSGLHAALVAALVFSLVRGLPVMAPGERIVAVVELPPLPEPTVADVIADNQQRDAADQGEETLALPAGEIDISRIRARQDALFPLLTEGLPDLTSARGRTGTREGALAWYVPEAAGKAETRALSLTDAELNRLVDKSWSRLERWRSFAEIATLVSEHDPNAGRAADLVRTHIDRNLLQPYQLTRHADAQFWVLLHLAVDQEPVIRFVERFVRDHPGSRVATELLFFLDELVMANHTTLFTLLVTEPERDLTTTRAADPQAYDLAVAIHRRYVGLLRERQLDSPEGIGRTYDDIRTRILTTIIQTTPDGYGAADARYLLGRILWNQERRAEAMETWRAIQPDDRGVYASFYERIRPEVLSPSPLTMGRISAALGAEYGAWRKSSEARLRQFGYTSGDF
jgi:hypothetical protein